MKVLFVGNFTQPSATGEEPDEKHIARCLTQTGTDVTAVDRAEVHAFFTGAKQDNIPVAEPYDIILVAKWHHLTAEIFNGLKDRYKGKLAYWVWDFMWRDGKTQPWHEALVKSSDYYVSGELGMVDAYESMYANFRYFNWDSADGQYDQIPMPKADNYDVVFTGTYIPHSYRNDYLRAVKEQYSLTVFSWDYEHWAKQGFTANPGQYGGQYRDVSWSSKIILCMNWPEVRPETFGYWSNRVGKIMTTGGLPLVHYVPGMERVLSDSVMYFHNQDDMLDKIGWLLHNHEQRETARVRAYDYGRMHMTTQKRMQEFKILLESL